MLLAWFTAQCAVPVREPWSVLWSAGPAGTHRVGHALLRAGVPSHPKARRDGRVGVPHAATLRRRAQSAKTGTASLGAMGRKALSQRADLSATPKGTGPQGTFYPRHRPTPSGAEGGTPHRGQRAGMLCDGVVLQPAPTTNTPHKRSVSNVRRLAVDVVTVDEDRTHALRRHRPCTRQHPAFVRHVQVATDAQDGVVLAHRGMFRVELLHRFGMRVLFHPSPARRDSPGAPRRTPQAPLPVSAPDSCARWRWRCRRNPPGAVDLHSTAHECEAIRSSFSKP